MPAYSLDSIAQVIEADIHQPCGDPITGIGTLADGQQGDIGFLAESQYQKYLAKTKLSAVIVRQVHPEVPCSQLVVSNVKSAWRRVVDLFVEPSEFSGIDKQAFIHPTASIAAEVTIEAGVSVGKHSVIGERCVIRAGTNIGAQVTIGRDCYINHGVAISDRSIIGNNAYINSGAVLGSRGFGFSFEDNRWQPIAQLGRVVIGDDVEIGANTTIDRGAVNDTIIGHGVKLDNLIQVGHNVTIGDHTIIAGCCVIAGSTTIGQYCLIGGASVLAGHIRLCDHVQITGHSSISKSIKEAGTYSSAFPAMPNKLWNRLVANVRRLDNKR